MAAGSSLSAVSYGFARFAYGLLEPAMRADLDLTAGLSGAIAAGSYVGYCVAIVLSMLLTPTLGPRWTATAAGILATAGMALVAVAPNAVLLAAGVLVAGSSTGAASPPLAAAVAARVREPRRDRAQTAVNAGTGLGVLVSGPIALAVGADWRAAWTVFAVTAALVTVWLHRTLAGPRPAAAASGDEGGGRDGGRPRIVPRRAPGSGRLLVSAFALGAVSVVTWTFGRQLVESAGGMSPAGSAWLWIVLGASGVLGAAGGDLTARVGTGPLWRILLAMMSAATALLAVGPGGAAAYAAAALFGATYIALTGLVLVGASRVWPDQVGAGVAVGFLAIALGQACAAPALGALAGTTGLAGAFGVAAGVGAAACLIGIPDRQPAPAQRFT